MSLSFMFYLLESELQTHDSQLFLVQVQCFVATILEKINQVCDRYSVITFDMDQTPHQNICSIRYMCLEFLFLNYIFDSSVQKGVEFDKNNRVQF